MSEKSINSITFGIDSSSSSFVRARAEKCHQKSFDKINSIISTSLECQRAFFPPFAPAQLCLIAMWHFWCVIWNLNLLSLLSRTFHSRQSHKWHEEMGKRKEIMKHKMKLFGKIPPQKKRQYEGAFLPREKRKIGNNGKTFSILQLEVVGRCQIPRTFVVNFKLKLFFSKPPLSLHSQSLGIWMPTLVGRQMGELWQFEG